MDTAIRLDAKDPEAFYWRGCLWQEKGNWDKVIKDYNAAITLNPEYAEALVDRGLVYVEIGRTERDSAISIHLFGLIHR